jgi:hypothetical protein
MRKIVFTVTMALCLFRSTGRATEVVHDPVHTTLNVLQQTIGQIKDATYHSQDMWKYTEMINRQIQQINQLTTMINQNVAELNRLGNPETYTNMLGLNELFREVNRIKSGVGQTIDNFRATANGIAALKETGEGLYQDLSLLPDRFGQSVQYDAESFKKLGVVQDMYAAYSNEINSANGSMARLQSQKEDTLRQLNTAGSLVETQKWKGKLEAIQGAIDNVTSRVTAAAQKILVQEAVNRSDEARRAEAYRQMKSQEMATETQYLRDVGFRLLGPGTGN